MLGARAENLLHIGTTYSTVQQNYHRLFFCLAEERHLFFEDISGVNLMLTPEYDVYLIDADSLVFYNETRFVNKVRNLFQ